MCHPGTVKTALCENTANNCIFITFRNIAAGDRNIVEEEARIGTVLSRIGDFSLGERRMQPAKLDNGNQGITGRFICRKVDGVGQQVGEFGQWGKCSWMFVDNGFGAMFFERRREL